MQPVALSENRSFPLRFDMGCLPEEQIGQRQRFDLRYGKASATMPSATALEPERYCHSLKCEYPDKDDSDVIGAIALAMKFRSTGKAAWQQAPTRQAFTGPNWPAES